nr:flagellar hook-length control protein FliK [uncultured Actinotalea sp.]
MTTIVMLPAPPPQPDARPARPGSPTADGDFSRTLEDAVDRAREDRRARERRDDTTRPAPADRAGAADRPRTTDRPGATDVPTQRGPATDAPADGARPGEAALAGTPSGAPALTTVGAVVDGAIADLARGAADAAVPSPTTTSTAVPPEGEEALAVVLDLTARLMAQTAARAGTSDPEGATATSGTTPGAAAGTTTGTGAGTSPVPTVPGAPTGPGSGPASLGADRDAGAAPTTAPVGGSAGTTVGTLVGGALASLGLTDPSVDGDGAPGTGTSAPAPTAPAASAAGASGATPTGVAVVGVPAETASVASTPAPVPAGAAQPAAPSLAEQLGARLATLRTLPVGDHVLTLRVDPDSFGPVRVVAHIGAEGVRIELVGASDAARDALRSALPDLRRDLAATGLSAQLDLGREQPGGASGRPDGQAGDGQRGAGAGGAQAGPDGRRGHGPAAPDAVVGGSRTSPTGGLDLLV